MSFEPVSPRLPRRPCSIELPENHTRPYVFALFFRFQYSSPGCFCCVKALNWSTNVGFDRFAYVPIVPPELAGLMLERLSPRQVYLVGSASTAVGLGYVALALGTVRG